jgi:hypothetical protein
MAIFNKNTLTQVSGFDNPIIAGELVWDQRTYWNLVFRNSVSTLPVDITDATIDATIVRRRLSNIQDSRNGLTFDIANYEPPPNPVAMTISNIDGPAGSCTLVIDDTVWDLINSDPELKINAIDPVGFSGRIKVSFPASGPTPEDDLIIFLLFLIRSDGVIVV